VPTEEEDQSKRVQTTGLRKKTLGRDRVLTAPGGQWLKLICVMFTETQEHRA